MKLQYVVFHMDTRFEKEEIKYSGPRKIYARFSDFAVHFGNFSPNPRARDWSTSTKIVFLHNCIQHIEKMHLYPKLGAKTRMILFFTSARTTQWCFYWAPNLYR
ncbi:unnamed protein product [Heterosigma akashiwo]